MTSVTLADRGKRWGWTSDEDAYLRENYVILGAISCAWALSRSVDSVANRAFLLGVVRRRIGAFDPFRDTIHRRHGEGWTDSEIAVEFGRSRALVARHRRAMGLPSNQSHPRQRAKYAAGTAERCRAAGVASLGALRSLAFRRYVEASGWPADLRPRHVQILDALADRGPMTRPEIADAIGLPWRGSRNSPGFVGPGGSYLAQLISRGLVVPLGKLVKGEGKGRALTLYSLAITAERSVDRG